MGVRCLVVAVLVAAVGCSGSKATVPEQKREPQQSDTIESDALFDLIDMLPLRAGDLSLVGASIFKGRGGYRLEPRKHQAIGYYQWASDGLSVAPSLAQRDATVKCLRNDPSGTEAVCISGASISWPGCTIDFRCEAWGKRKASDAITVATSVERWARRYRGDRDSIPMAEVKENRRGLLEALRRGD